MQQVLKFGAPDAVALVSGPAAAAPCLGDCRMAKAPDRIVLPLDALLSRRDFCRTAMVGGAALVTLRACGDSRLAVPHDLGRRDLRQSLFPEEDMSGGQPDMSTASPDMTEIPQPDMTGEIPDLTRPPDFVNPNACPNGVIPTN